MDSSDALIARFLALTVDSTTVTTMPGTDTVAVPTVVPTTDSVVTTTTTETDAKNSR